MDNEIKEILGTILMKVSGIETEVKELKTEVKELKTEVKELKETTTKIAKQVDILYNWVDGIDLNVKSNSNILNNLPLAK